MSKATLTVNHDGVRASAYVTLNGSSAWVDQVIEAALQSDAETAAEYRRVLADVAGEMYLHIDREIDGSRDNGCCWFAIRLTRGMNGETLTTRTHQITRTEFRGWSPTAEQIEAERKNILRRAVAIGLGSAQYVYGSGTSYSRTVADAAN